MRSKNLMGVSEVRIKNSTPSPRKRRKTTSSAIFCATSAWGLIILSPNLDHLHYILSEKIFESRNQKLNSLLRNLYLQELIPFRSIFVCRDRLQQAQAAQTHSKDQIEGQYCLHQAQVNHLIFFLINLKIFN